MFNISRIMETQFLIRLYSKVGWDLGVSIYLTVTYPDISFDMNIVSQLMSNPGRHHLTVVFCIIRYLCGTLGHGFSFFFFHLHLPYIWLHVDANWANSRNTQHSTTGWCMLLGNLKCKKHQVSKSSTDVEYHAMSFACSKTISLVQLLNELGIRVHTPIPLNADNTNAIQIALNPVLYKRVKHIEEDLSLNWGNIQENFSHSPMSHQFANIFTKAVTRDPHSFLISKLMLVDPHQYEGKYEGT